MPTARDQVNRETERPQRQLKQRTLGAASLRPHLRFCGRGFPAPRTTAQSQPDFFRPYGTRPHSRKNPGAEAPGYSRSVPDGTRPEAPHPAAARPQQQSSSCSRVPRPRQRPRRRADQLGPVGSRPHRRPPTRREQNRTCRPRQPAKHLRPAAQQKLPDRQRLVGGPRRLRQS